MWALKVNSRWSLKLSASSASVPPSSSSLLLIFCFYMHVRSCVSRIVSEFQYDAITYEGWRVRTPRDHFYQGLGFIWSAFSVWWISFRLGLCLLKCKMKLKWNVESVEMENVIGVVLFFFMYVCYVSCMFMYMYWVWMMCICSN